jgi:hypothetical protein
LLNLARTKYSDQKLFFFAGKKIVRKHHFLAEMIKSILIGFWPRLKLKLERPHRKRIGCTTTNDQAKCTVSIGFTT